MTGTPLPPLVDPAGIARLRSWGGPVLVVRMIELFAEQAALRLREVGEGMAEGDLDRVGRAAHSLKSSAANLGAERLQVHAAELEEKASGGDRDAVVRLAAVLPRSYEETVAELERLRPPGSDARES